MDIDIGETLITVENTCISRVMPRNGQILVSIGNLSLILKNKNLFLSWKKVSEGFTLNPESKGYSDWVIMNNNDDGISNSKDHEFKEDNIFKFGLWLDLARQLHSFTIKDKIEPNGLSPSPEEVFNCWPKLFLTTKKEKIPLPVITFLKSHPRLEILPILLRHLWTKRSSLDSTLYEIVEQDAALNLSMVKDAPTSFSFSNLVFSGLSKVTNEVRKRVPINQIDAISTKFGLKFDEISNQKIEESIESVRNLVTFAPSPHESKVSSNSKKLSSEEWNSYFDIDGKCADFTILLEKVKNMGLESSSRTEIWKFIFKYSSADISRIQRLDEDKEKRVRYEILKSQWKSISEDQECRFSAFLTAKNQIYKDILRTDRDHHIYRGDKNPNLDRLYNILMTYMMYNFDLGYVQGMNDILAPLIPLYNHEDDEPVIFWIFVELMNRTLQNFSEDLVHMNNQIRKIQTLVKFLWPDLYQHLEQNNSSHMQFMFEWLITRFKRLFTYEDIYYLWEVAQSETRTRFFDVFVAVAILDLHKTEILKNNLEEDQILAHMRSLTEKLDVYEVVERTRRLIDQLVNHRKQLPYKVEEFFSDN